MTAAPLPAPIGVPAPRAGGEDVELPGVGVRLRGTRWPGSRPGILVLHGLASTRRIWDLVVPHLVDGPDAPAVLALDQRGHGDSGRPGDGRYSSDLVVADALVAADAADLGPFVVAGHSWGATTALQLAAHAPEQVLACVALDGGTAPMVGPGRERESMRRRLTPPRSAVPVDQLEQLLARGPLGPWWSPAVARAVLSVFETGPDGLARARLPFQAHMAILDGLLDTDLEELWRAVTVPTWLVACLPSPAGDGHAGPQLDGLDGKRQALASAERVLRRGRVLQWVGAVHDVPLQWPALVAGLVRAARDDAAPRSAA